MQVSLEEGLLVINCPLFQKLPQSYTFIDDVFDELEHIAIIGYLFGQCLISILFDCWARFDDKSRLFCSAGGGFDSLEDAHGSLNIYYWSSVQSYQFVMGNTCQNCEKPTNPKQGIKEEAAKEDDRVSRPVDDAAKPYRPSLSKNDEKYFSNLDQTGERPTSSNAIEKKDPVKFKNGVIYHGEWRGNVRWGHGVQVWPDGAKYEGQWAAGKANGKGKFTHVDGDVYDGEWKDDKACGYGTYKHYNGAKYEGQWLEDYQHGKGTETWVDGSRYEGYYAEGKKNGEGKYTWKDGSYFVGNWKDNKINGFGVYVWSDGRQYKGYWLNNQMHGQGQYKWKDGRMYVGEYQYDKKHGFGTYTWADGRKYSGQWQNSKRHGRGKIVSLDGTQREGIWQQDRRVKWLDEGIGASMAGVGASAVAAQGRTTKKN